MGKSLPGFGVVPRYKPEHLIKIKVVPGCQGCFTISS